MHTVHTRALAHARTQTADSFGVGDKSDALYRVYRHVASRLGSAAWQNKALARRVTRPRPPRSLALLRPSVRPVRPSFFLVSSIHDASDTVVHKDLSLCCKNLRDL